MKSLKLLKEELLAKANNSRVLSSKEQKLISGGDEQGCKSAKSSNQGGPGGKWKGGKEICYYVNGECECRDS